MGLVTGGVTTSSPEWIRGGSGHQYPEGNSHVEKVNIRKTETFGKMDIKG